MPFPLILSWVKGRLPRAFAAGGFSLFWLPGRSAPKTHPAARRQVFFVAQTGVLRLKEAQSVVFSLATGS